ncbi:MAG: universal stress protein [Candidatus Methylomirabilales bacterium]
MSTTARITRILVPTDFSPAATVACRLAARLALRAEAELILFHALPGVELVHRLGETLARTQVEVLEEVRDQLREWLEAAVPAELRRFLTVACKVKVGEPTPGIAWAAHRSRADLILMATEGRTGLAHLLLGSVTEAVLRNVPVPVLALRLGQGDRPLTAVQRILWATDLSPVSEGAWHHALTLADVFGAELLLLHVVRPGGLAGGVETPVPLPAGKQERYLESLEDELARRQHVVEVLGLRARAKVQVGVPAAVIVAEAEEEQVDLIVMGTRGRTGLSHVLLGSVAEAVIRKAPCPVLAVQPRREAESRGRVATEAQGQEEASGDAPPAED